MPSGGLANAARKGPLELVRFGNESQDTVASVFFLEITNRRWFRNRKTGLEHLNAELRLYYRANPELSSLYPLVITQIVAPKPGYPTLKAKAAQTRHVAHFCAALANKHLVGAPGRGAFTFRDGHRLAGREAERRELVMALCDSMRHFHVACSARPFEEDPCKDSMRRYLAALSALHNMWRAGLEEAAQAKEPFNLRPKNHLLQHLVLDKIQHWGSPAEFWCYGDEDFVGRVKKICRQTAYPSTLEDRVLDKLTLLTGLDASVS